MIRRRIGRLVIVHAPPFPCCAPTTSMRATIGPLRSSADTLELLGAIDRYGRIPRADPFDTLDQPSRLAGVVGRPTVW